MGRARARLSEASSSVELHADGLGDESGTGRALDLDRVLRGDAHAAVDRLDRFDFLPQPNARAGRYLPGKADPVAAVIDAARAVLDAIDGLSQAPHPPQCPTAV